MEEEERTSSGKEIIVTPKIKHYIGKAFEFGSYFGGSPFKWNKSLERPEIGSKWQQYLWRINMILALSHSAFVLFRCIQVSTDEEVPLVQAIYMRFMAAYFMLGGAQHLGIIQNVDEFPVLVGQYLDFMEKFQKKFVIPNSELPFQVKATEMVLTLFPYSCFSIWTLMALVTLANPISHEQIPSLLLSIWSEDDLMVWPRIVSCCTTAYINYLYFSSALVYTQCGFGLMTFLAICDEMWYSPGGIYRTTEKLREREEILKHYRWIQLHIKWFNEVFVNLVVPSCKLMLILWCVFCTFGAIKMEGVASLALSFFALFSITFLIVMFTFLAEVLNRCSLVREYLTKTTAADPYLRRYVKSLQVVAVSLRRVYFVDNGMILTMIDGIIGQTVSFILVNG